MLSELRVTVLMAVYNGLPHVIDAVESILQQTYRDFELLVVDDGSIDGTADYLSGVDDSRLRVLHQDHGGVTKARNAGLAEARGEYLALQDADDISDPDRLRIQVEYLGDNQDVAAAGSWYRVMDQSGRNIFDRRLPRGDDILKTMLMAQSPIANGSAMVRTEVIRSVGNYRPEFVWTSDLDLWLRIADDHRIENIPQYLYGWRLPESGGSAVKRFRQKRYAALAVECTRARAIGLPEPLDRVRDVVNENPGVLWRTGFRAKATWRRLTNSLGIDVSPPYMGDGES